MVTIFLAMFLSVTQVAPPVPRKAADKSTSGSQNLNKHSNGKQAPAAPSLVPNAATPTKDQHESNPPTKTNAQETIVVRELPTVTVTTDRWSKLYVLFTGALMIIGGVGVFFALRTLNTIKEQTNATRKAAEATEKSVELQRVAMEQWIDTDFWEAGPKHIQPTATEADLPISFRLGNPTKFPLTLKSLMLWIDRKHAATVGFGSLLLPPDADTPLTITNRLEGVKLAYYRVWHLKLGV